MTTSCTKTRAASAITKVLGATALLVGMGISPPAFAAGEVPIGCNANTFQITINRDKSVAVPGETVNFGVSVVVTERDAFNQLGCNTEDVSIYAQCPDLTGTSATPPSTPKQYFPLGSPVAQDFPAPSAPTVIGSIACTMPAATAEQTVYAWSGAEGTLRSSDAGASFTRVNNIDVDLIPCQVKVDKQVSCDGGVTWVDPGLVLDNEDGTLDCSVIGLSGTVMVRYQAQNTSTECPLTSCVLTETNATFGTPPSVGGIAPATTTAFLPAANSPACSTAYGNPENPNEPNTVEITCQTGGTPVTASDIAAFDCLKIDAQVDRQVSCDDKSTWADEGLERTNEDGTNGCTAVDTEPVNWQYQGCNAGTAPLYDCTLVDLNQAYVSDPIVLGNLAPMGETGDCSALTASSKSPKPCSNALEASEAPDNGKVTMTCCTGDVANIAECLEANRVSVYDVSTVTCSTPAGLNAVKECIDTNADGNDDKVRVVATATGGDIGFTGCTAADVLYREGACPAEGDPTGASTAIPLTPEGGFAYPFSIAPLGERALFGTIDPALDAVACNTASVTCTDGYGQTVTATAPPVTCNYEEKEGCITRTPGFWATHPGDDDRIGTYDFLPQTICGVELNTVLAGSTNSATEAMCSVGKDSKLPGTSPQLTQLIRQCTAAHLNVAISAEEDGDCLSDYPQLGDALAACCGSEESVCTSGYEGTLSINECIYILDEFNNSMDTLDSELLAKPGPASPRYCQQAKNNGVAIIP